MVIPNYNGQDLIKKNLPKVLGAVGDAEVIVVDDASTDGSVEVLGGFRSRIEVLRDEKNLGFSSTVNRGVDQAKGEIVVLLNTDVVPEKDFLKPLLPHFKDSLVFGVGCLDKSIENGKIVLRGRGIGKWQRGFLVHSKGEIDRKDTLWVSGGSSAFRKSIWRKLGGFNEIYNPFYYEDIDLSYRALKSGYKILFEAKSIVVHKHEEGAIKKEYLNSYIKTIAYRNQFIFVWENATDLYLQLLHIFFLPYHFLKALVRGDFIFFLGFFKAFILLPKIIKSSFKAQKLFIKKDKEVIGEVGKF